MIPVLETERYILAGVEPADQEFVFRGLSDPAVIPFYGVSYSSFEETSSQMDFYASIWANQTGCWWKIIDRASNQPIGACGINNYQSAHEKAELGYWLLPLAWKKGVMKEVLPVVLAHLFTQWKLHRLEAVIEPGNDASIRLAQSLGFQFEGEMREAEIKQGRRINLQMYSLLKTDLDTNKKTT